MLVMSKFSLKTNSHVHSGRTVGVDLLSTISDGLYNDALEVYRELVQNSADAYELCDTSPSKRIIQIDVSRETRNARFRDFATGMSAEKMATELVSLGRSTKKNSQFRGFRGIGRLAALGYCKRLTFRSRQQASQMTMELSWDCQMLNELLRSSESMDIETAIKTVSDFKQSSCSDNDPTCFFDCVLEGVKFTKNDALINPHLIGDYLSETGPVPFDEKFKFRHEIGEILKPVNPFTLHIHINGSTEWLTRPHRNCILKLDGSTTTTIHSVEEISHVTSLLNGGESKLKGWVLNHDFPGALPIASHVRGLRTRVGNMQIGNDATWSYLFQEPRFNLWHISEVHIDSSALSPNTRRDSFASSSAFDDLQNEISTIATNFSDICRNASKTRNAQHQSKQQTIILPNDAYSDILSQLKVSEPLPGRVVLTPATEQDEQQ